MPIHLSAKKRLKQSQKAKLRNKAIKSNLKSLIKKVKRSTDPKEAESNFKAMQSLLDRATRFKIIHKNKASRQKEKLAKLINQKFKT